jgi:hypothetical protein
MNSTVEWHPHALQELADIWNNAPDRPDVVWASNTIDDSLSRDPLGQGESRVGKRRILFLPPLAVIYDVYKVTNTVEVVNVWRYPN